MGEAGSDHHRRQNRLGKEKNPYLLLHAENPVDWYPWGSEAFERARIEDRPVFLSIGYSTCHWCHVMMHESFEDAEVARLLNETFVCVKVDREERPDLDSLYMTAAQVLSCAGGWPLTIIMTPDKKPFYAATYIPKTERAGMVGMLELVPAIHSLWLEKRDEINASSSSVLGAIGTHARLSPSGEPGSGALDSCFEDLTLSFDPLHGGFGGAPKFPAPHILLFLLRYWKRSGNAKALGMVETTLGRMRTGGVYDQLGFGFHRYATDAAWKVPHFEKMLFDQALCAMAYTEAFLATGDASYRRTAGEIFEYVLRDLTDPGGGFYTAEDADSAGIEGGYYLWTSGELVGALEPEEADLARRLYGVSEDGNFTGAVGKNILQCAAISAAGATDLTEEIRAGRPETIRKKLLSRRSMRPHPARDDKILTDWNGLMIAALSMAGSAFGENKYLRAAEQATAFILGHMVGSGHGLFHSFRDGNTSIEGMLDDYAFFIWGLIECYEAAFAPSHLEAAVAFTKRCIRDFWDESEGGFFQAPDRAGDPPVRLKISGDGSVPSGNAVMAYNLVRLSGLTGDATLEKAASDLLRSFSGRISARPSGHTMLLCALDFMLGPSREIVISGLPGSGDTRRMIQELGGMYLPRTVVVLRPPGDEGAITRIAPYTGPMEMRDRKATAYVCTGHACVEPVTDPLALRNILSGGKLT